MDSTAAFPCYDAGFHPGESQGRTNTIDRPAAQVVARAASWLAHNTIPGPFFLWIHLNDPEAATAASYNSAISAVDAAAGKLIAALRADKVYDNTIIMVVSDHGQSLAAHGEETHGVFLYDETIHVPLVVKLPGEQGCREKSASKG